MNAAFNFLLFLSGSPFFWNEPAGGRSGQEWSGVVSTGRARWLERWSAVVRSRLDFVVVVRISGQILLLWSGLVVKLFIVCSSSVEE